jgi:hypothetical protein
MHTVQNSVRPGIQKGRTLKNKGQRIKDALPAFAEGEHFMGSISVQKESLEKQRQKPVGEKES